MADASDLYFCTCTWLHTHEHIHTHPPKTVHFLKTPSPEHGDHRNSGLMFPSHSLQSLWVRVRVRYKVILSGFGRRCSCADAQWWGVGEIAMAYFKPTIVISYFHLHFSSFGYLPTAVKLADTSLLTWFLKVEVCHLSLCALQPESFWNSNFRV